MALTEVERAKLVVLIDQMVQHKNGLERKLKESEASFAAAWATYGSELAGDDGSRLIREELKTCQQKIDLLERCQSGILDISEENVQAACVRVQRLRIQSQELREQIQKQESILSDIREVRDALCFKL